jgi:hypothetical protein
MRTFLCVLVGLMIVACGGGVADEPTPRTDTGDENLPDAGQPEGYEEGYPPGFEPGDCLDRGSPQPNQRGTAKPREECGYELKDTFVWLQLDDALVKEGQGAAKALLYDAVKPEDGEQLELSCEGSFVGCLTELTCDDDHTTFEIGIRGTEAYGLMFLDTGGCVAEYVLSLETEDAMSNFN